MIYNHIRRAYHKTHRFLGSAYHEARKYAHGFDTLVNIVGRTVLTLQPLLDEVAPQARRTLTKGLEDYDLVRSKVMGAHQTGQRYVSALQRNVPELNLS